MSDDYLTILDKNSKHYNKVNFGDVWANGGWRNGNFVYKEVFVIVSKSSDRKHKGFKIINSRHENSFKIIDLALAQDSDNDKTWVKLSD